MEISDGWSIYNNLTLPLGPDIFILRAEGKNGRQTWFVPGLGGSLGIAPMRNCTHFLKNGFVVAGGGFYSYYNKWDKEMKIVRKKLSFMHTKRLNTFLKYWCSSVWVQFHVKRFRVYPHNTQHKQYRLSIILKM